jgi:hypothetical protein
MSFTEEEARTALTYARNGAMFMYRANEKLAAEVLKGGPSSTGMPKLMQGMIMTREWINIDSEMVIKYCLKTLDSKNSYVFDNGDIKVIPEPYNPIKIS